MHIWFHPQRVHHFFIVTRAWSGTQWKKCNFSLMELYSSAALKWGATPLLHYNQVHSLRIYNKGEKKFAFKFGVPLWSERETPPRPAFLTLLLINWTNAKYTRAASWRSIYESEKQIIEFFCIYVLPKLRETLNPLINRHALIKEIYVHIVLRIKFCQCVTSAENNCVIPLDSCLLPSLCHCAGAPLNNHACIFLCVFCT